MAADADDGASFHGEVENFMRDGDYKFCHGKIVGHHDSHGNYWGICRPLNILAEMPGVLADPMCWRVTGSTLGSVILGLAIALVRAADRMLDHYVNGFYAMPMVAVLPLLTTWFGYDESARLATVVFAGLFSVMINVSDSARSVPSHYMEVAHS